MGMWQCTICGYIYDPQLGDPDNEVAPGTRFEDIPDDWVCPDCGVDKEQFIPYVEEEDQQARKFTGTFNIIDVITF